MNKTDYDACLLETRNNLFPNLNVGNNDRPNETIIMNEDTNSTDEDSDDEEDNSSNEHNDD